MKLKPIPTNTVVHTPTEAEAKELLLILHEDGYRWRGGASLAQTSWLYNKANTCYSITKCIGYCYRDWYESKGSPILTLAEFKRQYCEEENSQAKPKVGDRVEIQETYYKEELHGRIGVVTSSPTPFSYYVEIDNTIYQVSAQDLKPYNNTELKPTEDMETKELNLCELLKGYEGETFYSPYIGECRLDEITHNSDHPIGLRNDDDVWVALPSCGHEPDGVVMLFPSRALYEQYPLDPYTAWMKWQEGQKKHWVSVTAWIDDVECESDTSINTDKIYFRTPADRNKCIEEIKAIIEKYSKK